MKKVYINLLATMLVGQVMVQASDTAPSSGLDDAMRTIGRSYTQNGNVTSKGSANKGPKKVSFTEKISGKDAKRIKGKLSKLSKNVPNVRATKTNELEGKVDNLKSYLELENLSNKKNK